MSEQVGTWHFRGFIEQTRLWQSDATAHVLPSRHAPHIPSPQSMSVSGGVLMLSVQLAVWQVPDGQMAPAMQSPLPLQCLPTPHLFVQVLPQSTSVSVPFLTP